LRDREQRFQSYDCAAAGVAEKVEAREGLNANACVCLSFSMVASAGHDFERGARAARTSSNYTSFDATSAKPVQSVGSKV
jgi:hypothetical protein